MLNSKQVHLISIVIFPIGILAISSSSILTRLGQSEAPSLVIAFFRLIIATLLLMPIVLIKNRQEFSSINKKASFSFGFAGLFLALHFASWITSLEYTTIASSVVLVTTTPIWVALFSPLFLKEKINMKVWVGIFFSVAGGIIVASSQSCQFITGHGLICPEFGEILNARSFLGNFLALVGAWMAAGYLIVGRKMRNRFSISFYAFCVYGIAAILLFIALSSSHLKLSGYQNKTYFWMILLGIIPQLIGHSSFNWALGYLPAALVSVGIMGEPVGTIILASIIFNEIPRSGELAGGILILAGILVVSLANRQASRKNLNL